MKSSERDVTVEEWKV